MKKDESGKKYSISEFAKTCGTTKDTLYHYEKQGILIPSTDETNHYRYYSLNDFHLFQYIAHLRRMGFSVSEIRDCIRERNVKTYLEILALSQKKCLDEISEAQRRYDIVTKTREATFRYSHIPLETPRIEYAGEEYFFLSPFRGDLNTIDGINQIRLHLSAAEIMPDVTSNLMVFKVKKERLNSGRSHNLDIMIQTSNPSEINEDSLHVKPAGFYLHIYYCMDLTSSTEEERDEAFQKMKGYIDEHNYSIMTDLYCYNHISRFLTDDPKEFLSEFVIGLA